MKIVICDIYVKLVGHNLGHIQNILRFLEKNPSQHEFVFLLNPEAKEIPSIRTSASNISIHFFTDEEFSVYTSQPSIIKASSNIWKLIEHYTMAFGADRLLLMMVDVFQHTVGSSKIPVEIQGLMFNPYTRVMPENQSIKAKIKYFLNKNRKLLTTAWMCKNKKLKKIFIFNDSSTVERLNKALHTNIFTYLPDPVYDYPMRQNLDVREKHEVSLHRKIFLLFGSIDEKKNVINFLKAAQTLSSNLTEKICLMIVGRVRPEYLDSLAKTISETQQICQGIQIILENRFVEDDEMEAYVGQSDVISIAYVNFYSSSGVIGLAARHNKPVIATKFGVVGDQTRAYELGLTVDGHRVPEIADAMKYYIENECDYPKKAKAFVNQHTSDCFIKTLLEITD